MAARQYSRDVVLTAMRAEEDALHAKNRTKPPEAYLPHTHVVLEAVRAAEGDELPAGIKALVKQCEEAGHRYAVGKTLATDTDGFGEVRYVESVCLSARVNAVPWKRRTLLVAYENGKFARTIDSASGIGTLTDAKLALGIAVPPRKPREVKPRIAVAKPAGKADTLR